MEQRLPPKAHNGVLKRDCPGFKVLRKIENIVHEEQLRAGHLPMLMPTIQSADLWRESGRYDAYGAEMLRITDRHDRDMLFTPTAEELITKTSA